MSDGGSFRNTCISGRELWRYGDPRRGSKEDLIVIVNNTKTHRPTIILGKYARDCKST